MKNNFYLLGLVLLITFAFTVVVTPAQAVTSVNENADVTEVEDMTNLPKEANVRAHQVQECLQISRVIRQGASGEEVKQLQEFLKEKGYFEFDKITGYYGPVTEDAVKKFQAKEGLVSKGNPETTGYGQIGPKTRARIAKRSCLTENKPDVDNDDDDENNDDDSATVEELEKTIAALEAQIVRLKAKVAKIKAQKEQGDDTDEDEDEEEEEEEVDEDGEDEENEGGEE